MVEKINQRLLDRITAATEVASERELEAATRDFRSTFTQASRILSTDDYFQLLSPGFTSFYTTGTEGVKIFSGNFNSFDLAVYGCGGPDIAQVEGMLSDNGHLISIGEENILNLPEVVYPITGERDYEFTELAYDLVKAGLYSSPNSADPTYRGLYTYLASLYLAGADPQTLAISERKVLKDDNGQETASMTTLDFDTTAGKHITHTLFSGITLGEEPLRPKTDPAIFVLAELRKVMPNNGSSVLGISKGSHRIGVLPFAKELPSGSVIVTDTEEEQLKTDKARSALRGHPTIDQITFPRPTGSKLFWGYNRPQNRDVTIYHSKLR